MDAVNGYIDSIGQGMVVTLSGGVRVDIALVVAAIIGIGFILLGLSYLTGLFSRRI
jgi:energy-converting hydrogenase Eha subunit C